MSLDDEMKKLIVDKKDNIDKNINFKKYASFLTLGFRIVFNYIFFIFLIGKFLASFLGFKNLFVLSIFLATLVNIVTIIYILKDNNK